MPVHFKRLWEKFISLIKTISGFSSDNFDSYPSDGHLFEAVDMMPLGMSPVTPASRSLLPPPKTKCKPGGALFTVTLIRNLIHNYYILFVTINCSTHLLLHT